MPTKNPSHTSKQNNNENIFERVATFFIEHQLPDHYAALCDFSWRQRDAIEASIHARHPALSAAAADNAAHTVLRRIRHLAPEVALACSAPQFKERLGRLLKPCIQFSALDEVRKSQRQQSILDAHFPAQMEDEPQASVNAPLLSEELPGLLLALRVALSNAQSALTITVLDILQEHSSCPGGLRRARRGEPTNEFIRAELKKRRIYAGPNHIKAARSRLAQIAHRLLEEWSSDIVRRGPDPRQVIAAASSAPKQVC
jgi:hypothetical protein